MTPKALAAIIFLLIAAPAAAQPPGSRNGWSLGVAVISSPEPYVDADNETLFVPALSITAGRFSFRGIAAAWQLGEWGDFEAEAILRARFSGYDAEDSPFLEGMEDRRKSADLGFALTWEREQHYGLRLTPAVDVLGRSDGVEVALDAFVPMRFGSVRLEPRVGAAWQSADLVDYYYGVRPEEALPGRPAYRGEATVNATAGLFVFSPLSQRLLLQTFLRLERLGPEIEDSPIVADATALTAFAAVSYRFF
jgi:MipA family protein